MGFVMLDLPLGFDDMLVIGVLFLCRELELSTLMAVSVSLNLQSEEITIVLPMSKTELKAESYEGPVV